MPLAHLALGSNLGDRSATLDAAVRRLRAEPELRFVAASPYYETAPVGGPSGQGAYLNAAVTVETSLSPDTLLARLLSIEQQFGRQRTVPDAPRTLDLDLLLYGDLIRTQPDPIVPHPRMHQRAFVLTPLAAIAPDAVHPTTGQTIAELLASLPPEPMPIFTPTPRRELEGLRVCVTGSTSGIGLAIAEMLTLHGASVIRHGRRPHSDAIAADVRDAGECERLVEEAWNRHGGLDAWVNNAGADLLTTEAASYTFERKWAELNAVDVLGTMRLARLVGERMRQGRGGTLVNIGWDQSATGMDGDSGQLFGAAKAAVTAFSLALAVELAPKVCVNVVAPGWIRTAWGETARPEWQERVRQETPMACWGLPEDVARAVRWLIAPEARYITGQVLRVNGGAVRG